MQWAINLLDGFESMLVLSNGPRVRSTATRTGVCILFSDNGHTRDT